MQSGGGREDVEMILGIRIAESMKVTIGIILCQLRTLTRIQHTQANTFLLIVRERQKCCSTVRCNKNLTGRKKIVKKSRSNFSIDWRNLE